jgi:hypothetical protein
MSGRQRTGPVQRARARWARPIAGRSARRRFDERLRVWRRRLWLPVFLASVVPAVAFLIAAFLVGGQAKVYFGAAAGGCLALYMWFRDSPPPHIENWRTGSDGERRTAKVLRPLEKEGWRVWHDIARPGGYNFDHVVVGPPGIFLLDTKNYLGEASIQDGELRVKWLEDPDDGWTRKGLTNRMRGASFELKTMDRNYDWGAALGAAGGRALAELPRTHCRGVEPVVRVFRPRRRTRVLVAHAPRPAYVGVPAHRRSPRGCTRCRCSALDLLIRCDDPSTNSHSWLACEVGGIRSSGAHYE